MYLWRFQIRIVFCIFVDYIPIKNKWPIHESIVCYQQIDKKKSPKNLRKISNRIKRYVSHEDRFPRNSKTCYSNLLCIEWKWYLLLLFNMFLGSRLRVTKNQQLKRNLNWWFCLGFHGTIHTRFPGTEKILCKENVNKANATFTVTED